MVGTWGAEGLKQRSLGLSEPEGLLGSVVGAFGNDTAVGW